MPEEGQISEGSWVAGWSVTVEDVPLLLLLLLWLTIWARLTTLAITSAQLSEHKTMGFLIR